MRIVVRSALLFALVVALPSIAAAQSRYYSDQPAYSTPENGRVYNGGYDTGRYAPMPKGWIYENDNGGHDGAAAGTVESDSDSRYGNPAGTVESDSDTRYGNPAGTVESDSDTRYGNPAGTVESDGSYDNRYGESATVEGEGGSDERYGETAGTVEGEGGYDSRDGNTTETVEGGSDYRYGGPTTGFQEFGSRPTSGYRSSQGRYGSTARARGRVINCYIDRRGRTICR